MYELERAKDGNYTLKYDGKYIHSKYNPVKEGKQFLNNNDDLLQKNKILLYGIGLGYHIIELLKKYTGIIYIFEWNEDIIEYCKKVNGQIFENSNVKLISGKDKSFYRKLAELLNQVGDILIHRQSLYTIKESNEELYNLLNDFSTRKQLIEINKKTSYKYDENYEKNRKGKYSQLNEFVKLIKNIHKPIAITAAGPSLDSQLKYLKENRNKFIVFTVGSALRTVIESKIYPDAIFLIDGSSEMKRQFIGFENLNVPLCFSAYASNEAVAIYNGPKYIFNDKDDSKYEVDTGGSVAVAALSIAVKCNPKEIIFLGQDLALIEGKNHVDSYKKMHNDRKDCEYRLIEVDGVDGEKVKTMRVYILFRNSIEKIIKANTNIRFINCSKGVIIKGTESIDFKLYLDKLLIEKGDSYE